jgi:hypothetical protein
MVSTVAAERSKLQKQYPELRLQILDYFNTLPLVGRGVSGSTYKLPTKLGHWGSLHSAKVRKAAPELEHIVRQIEALLASRAAEAIVAKHVRRKPGGKRKRDRERVQLNPGEWPPRYR